MSAANQPILATSVACCYANQDKRIRDELARRFEFRRKQSSVFSWCDYEIDEPWVERQTGHDLFEGANVVLLLISTDFLNSAFSDSVEMRRALQRHAAGEICLIPVILDEVNWSSTPIGKLRTLASNAEPVSNWRNVAAAFHDLVDEIDQAVEQWSEHHFLGSRDVVRVSNPKMTKMVDSGLVDGLTHRHGDDVSELREIDVLITYTHKSFRHHIPPIKRWCLSRRSDHPASVRLRVSEESDLLAAIQRLRTGKRHSVLVAIGSEFAEVSEILSPEELAEMEVILHEPEWASEYPHRPSASLVSVSPTVTRQGAIPAIRKSVLRLWARSQGSLRLLRDKKQLRQYLSLRYDAWKSLGYLTSQADCPDVRLELHYSDRTAIPIGFFSHDGKLLGGARLVRGLGRENPAIMEMVDKLLAEVQSPKLKEQFDYPPGLNHPYDVLDVFPGFAQYYRELVTKAVPKAEVSRVIISPAYRGQGLGEVLLDSLVSAARTLGIRVLFLGCREEHAGFYEKSGFRVIAGMRAEKFINIQQPSIAMEWREDWSA